MIPSDCLAPGLLRGKTVFVTGGGSGINLAIARAFARAGAGVAICGRTAEKLQAARAELEALGARVSTAVADVRDEDAMAAALEQAGRELAPVDAVVCGAAGNFLAPAEKMNAKGFRTVVDIDLVGSFNAAHAAFEQLRQTRGSLLFVSAGQAHYPFRFQAHVGAAKAGVDNLMRNLALEWAPYGIRSNAIVPGPIADTEGMKRLAGGDGYDAWIRSVPLRRFGDGDEIGALAVVLASPLGAYVTGASLSVDGGLGLVGSALVDDVFAAAVQAGRPS